MRTYLSRAAARQTARTVTASRSPSRRRPRRRRARHRDGDRPLEAQERADKRQATGHRASRASAQGGPRSATSPRPSVRRCASHVSHQIKSVRCIQQVAYQSSGNGIRGQVEPLSLAALWTGAFGNGGRATKTFRSKGSGVAISGNPQNSVRMGRYSCCRSTPQIPVFRTTRWKPQSLNHDTRAFAGLLHLRTLSQGTELGAGKQRQLSLRKALQRAAGTTQGNG